MAENVQRKLENLRPILEQMEKLQLFTSKEIQEITKKWKNYEYILQRRIKSKADYLQYIQYQLHLMKLIKHRRHKYGITKQKSDVDFAIAKKIHHLYKEIIFKYQNDSRIWLAYMSFCKKVDFKLAVKKMLGRMLSLQHTKAKIWHIAACWEIEEEKDLETAKLLLYRALLFHPDSQLIYTDLLRLELEESIFKNEKINSEKKIENLNLSSNLESPSGFESVFILYKQATSIIKDIKFLINLSNITKKYQSTEKLQMEILNDMIRDYPHEALMWDTIVKIEYEGLVHFSVINGNITLMNADNFKMSSLRNRIENCYKIYKVALKKLKSQEIWSLYINFMIQINQEQSNSLPNFKRKLLRNALAQGHQSKKLQEKHYLYWIDILDVGVLCTNNNPDNKLSLILSWATEALPKSEKLWEARLCHYFKTNQEDTREIFNKAVENLGENSLSIWKLRLLQMQSKNPEDLKKFFEEALKSNKANLNNYFKPLYIEWLVLNRGINVAREVYDKLCMLLPSCLELHRKMAYLEMSQFEIASQFIRKIYEIMTLQFGKQTVSVWLEYAIFEMKFGDAAKVSNIYHRAVKILNSSLVQEFIAKFSLIKVDSSLKITE